MLKHKQIQQKIIFLPALYTKVMNKVKKKEEYFILVRGYKQTKCNDLNT